MMTNQLSEYAISIGLRENIHNLSDEKMKEIFNSLLKMLQADMAAYGSLFVSDQILYEEYCEFLDKKIAEFDKKCMEKIGPFYTRDEMMEVYGGGRRGKPNV